MDGIHASNILPAEFIYDNLMVETPTLYFAFKTG